MNGVIEREPAVATLNNAEQAMSQAAGAIRGIQEEICNLALDLKASEGTQMINAERTFYDELSKTINMIATNIPNLHERTAILINSAGAAVGEMVTFYPASYMTNQLSGAEAIKTFKGIGIKDLNNAMGYCQSMNNRTAELSNIFEEALLSYQKLYGLAAEFPAVQESSHEIATYVRTAATTIANAARNFSQAVASYLESVAVRTEENKAEVDAQLANINHLTSSMSDMMMSLPSA